VLGDRVCVCVCVCVCVQWRAMHTMWARRSVLAITAMLATAQCSTAVGNGDDGNADLGSAGAANMNTILRQSDDGASGRARQLHEKDISAILNRLSALESQVQDLQKQLRVKDSGVNVLDIGPCALSLCELMVHVTWQRPKGKVSQDVARVSLLPVQQPTAGNCLLMACCAHGRLCWCLCWQRLRKTLSQQRQLRLGHTDAGPGVGAACCWLVHAADSGHCMRCPNWLARLCLGHSHFPPPEVARHWGGQH